MNQQSSEAQNRTAAVAEEGIVLQSPARIPEQGNSGLIRPSYQRILDAFSRYGAMTPDELAANMDRSVFYTRPRCSELRAMGLLHAAAFVMHDLGMSDGAIARNFGGVHRITILVRRRRMAEKLETTRRYRDYHNAILARIAGGAVPTRQDNNVRSAARSVPSAGSALSC